MIWESKKVKLLGVTIDNLLRFEDHISMICLKANKKLSILSRLSRFLSSDKKRGIFKAFLKLNFDIVLWYG